MLSIDVCIRIDFSKSNQFHSYSRKDASDVSGYYHEHFAMQHDLLRELAIHQSSQEPIEQRKRFIVDIRGNDLPRWWIEQGQHPIHARLVSLSTGLLSCVFEMMSDPQ